MHEQKLNSQTLYGYYYANEHDSYCFKSWLASQLNTDF